VGAIWYSKLCTEQLHDLLSSKVMTVNGYGGRGIEGGNLPSHELLKVRHNLEDLGLDGRMLLKFILQNLDGVVGEWINLADGIDRRWAAVSSVMIVRLHKVRGAAVIAGVLLG
jgi:hypothetical protein